MTVQAGDYDMCVVGQARGYHVFVLAQKTTSVCPMVQTGGCDPCASTAGGLEAMPGGGCRIYDKAGKKVYSMWNRAGKRRRTDCDNTDTIGCSRKEVRWRCEARSCSQASWQVKLEFEPGQAGAGFDVTLRHWLWWDATIRRSSPVDGRSSAVEAANSQTSDEEVSAPFGQIPLQRHFKSSQAASLAYPRLSFQIFPSNRYLRPLLDFSRASALASLHTSFQFLLSLLSFIIFSKPSSRL